MLKKDTPAAAESQSPTSASGSIPKLGFPYYPLPIAALRDRRLSPGDAAIISRIAYAANGNHGWCTLANKTIAFDTGLSEATVERRLPHIERCGYLKRKIEKNGTRSGISVNWERFGWDFVTPHESGQVTPHESGQVPPTKVGTEENDKNSSENFISAGAEKYYASETGDRVRNGSSPYDFTSEKPITGNRKRNRKDLVGTREIDQAFQEELVSQGKAPAPAAVSQTSPKPPATAPKSGVTEIRRASDINKIPWWPREAWSEFLDHRLHCGLKNTNRALVVLARQVVEIRDAGYDPEDCLYSSVGGGNGFHVNRPPDTYPNEWSWSA
jgi:hypothetical protein